MKSTAGLTTSAKATVVRRPASAKASAVRRSFSEGGSFTRRRKACATSRRVVNLLLVPSQISRLPQYEEAGETTGNASDASKWSCSRRDRRLLDVGPNGVGAGLGRDDRDDPDRRDR